VPDTTLVDTSEAPAVVRVRGTLPFTLYVLTGFTGLLAEQGFEKYISLLVGATASASAVVLFTYFLGFALGGIAAARGLRRIRRPLMAYGLIEGLVGLSCVTFAYSFHGMVERLAPLQAMAGGPATQFYVRFLCGCLLVLPTAALMGASFPLIAAVLDSADAGGVKRWSQAYSANLAGALAAALLAPLAIMPWLGLRGAMWLCLAINGCVCAAALAARQPAGARECRPKTDAGLDSRGIRLLIAASFASGAVFFALEVIWTHLIGVVIGCSIYAFSWMLAAVLLGLLLGARIVNRGVQAGHVMRASILFQVATLLLLAQLRLWDRVTVFFNIAPPAAFQDSFYFAEIYKLCLAALLLVPSSTVLGLIYPRLLASPQLKGAGSQLAGYLSAANSLGCLSGALLGIFVLVPRAGSEFALKLIILALGTLWLLFVRQESPTRPRLLRTAVVALAILAMTGTWHWSWGPLTAGTGNYFGHKPVAEPVLANVKILPASIIFRHEDVQGGMTTVMEQTVITGSTSRLLHTMYTNGKFQGDDNAAWGEGRAQFGVSAIPSLFVENYDRALVIGLGTGHSVAALKHLGYRDIDIAEFAPGIVRAADQCFALVNEHVLSDPSVHLHLEDGRNVLLADQRTRYDLITIELTSIWFAGATNLYSREFYELAHQRLKPGGILQQWVQMHHIGPREVASALATVRTVFPHASLWFYGGQGMIVASDGPLVVTDARRRAVAERLTGPKLAAELEAARLLGSEGVDRLIAAMHPVVNTDHNRWIEYATPHYQSSSEDWVAHNRRFLAQYQ
jgi:spermidine synthase